MNVHFWESGKNFDEFSSKAFSGIVNYSGMGICHKIMKPSAFIVKLGPSLSFSVLIIKPALSLRQVIKPYENE